MEELGDVNNDVQINSDDIDAYHITNAYLTVKAWLEEANDLKAIGAEIREKIRTYTRFIWYEVKGDIKPEIIFTNINMGKIKLTNAELIKALLLKQDNYKGENDDVIKVSQIKISTAWDNMEAKLQRDDLWRFLTGSGKFSKSETHMELIFRIMAKDIVKDRIRNNPEFYVENEEELNKDIVIRDDKKITDVESISEEIKNNNWFSSSWLNDPTIKAMLNMLDSIHEIFKGEDYEDFFEKLTDDDEDSYIIYFYFLDLGEYNLGDSIYIKLNARGKDLTNYENFKAKLSKYITDEIGTPKDDYIAKLDGEWSEVFWEFVKDNSTKLYDEKIMNFFTNFMINEYAAYMTASGRDPVRAEIREVIGYSHLDFINRFQGYNDKWDGHKIADSFVKIFELFDLMTSGKNQVIFAQGNKYFDEQALFKWIIENNDTEKADNKSGISYSTRIQADAYLGFIIQNNSLISTPDVFKEKLIDWMRVVMTLSRETNYNGGDDYVRAISKGVRKMFGKTSLVDWELTYFSAIEKILFLRH